MSKLTQKEFLKMIGILKASYTNFRFEETERNGKPSLSVIVWYEALKVFDYNDVYEACFAYIRNNVYPPSSPASIINEIKRLKLNRLEDAESIYNRFIGVFREEKYIVSKTKERLKTEPIVSQRAFDLVLPSLSENGVTKEAVNTWIKKEFIEIYNRLVEREVYNGTLSGDYNLRLGDGK